jgi:hypothetical protein
MVMKPAVKIVLSASPSPCVWIPVGWTRLSGKTLICVIWDSALFLVQSKSMYATFY